MRKTVFFRSSVLTLTILALSACGGGSSEEGHQGLPANPQATSLPLSPSPVLTATPTATPTAMVTPTAQASVSPTSVAMPTRVPTAIPTALPLLAQAGSAQSVLQGAQVSLNGSASTGRDLSYMWRLTSRPLWSNATLSAATSAKPSFTADQAGLYVATLTVQSGNQTSTASVQINVVNDKAGKWALTGHLGSHDPAVIHENGIWYEFHTGANLPYKTSSDGLNWSEKGGIFSAHPAWWAPYDLAAVDNEVWAPDIAVYNGRAYLYYSVTAKNAVGGNVSAIGLVSAASVAELVAGHFTDHGLILNSTSYPSSKFNAIDPSLVLDKEGQPWLVFGSGLNWWQGVLLVQLNPATMKPVSAQYHNIAHQLGDVVVEGPSIIYRNGYYYLFVSVGTCCKGVESVYEIQYGRSKSITGPYLDKNGVDLAQGGGTRLYAGDGVGSQWISAGGQTAYNNDTLVYHSYNAWDKGYGNLQIRNLKWVDGWPAIE